MGASDNAPDESMGNSKYTALDHEGLEVVSPSEAPEVAQDEAWRSQYSSNRKSSLLVPEAVNAAPPYKERESAFFGKKDRDEEGLQAIGRHDHEGLQHNDAADQSYAGSDAKMVGVFEEEVDVGRSRKRYCCGLSRRMLIALIAVIILVVVVGAVLGGVLGTMLNKKSKPVVTDDGPLQTVSQTGIATVISSENSDQLLTYFQDPEGRIIENSYENSVWSLSDRTNINKSIVTTAATPGSPLAAISYSYNNQNYRQIFFVTSTGSIMTANSTKTIPGTSIATSWSVARSISTDIVAPNSIGLAACQSESLMNGIRVFYPSQYGYIQELRYDFGGNGSWLETDYWKRADTSTGFACAVKSTGSGSSFLNLYLRLTSPGTVKQFWNDYSTGEWIWDEDSGPESWANQTIAPGSDIAVASDDSQTEYVYYQLDGGAVTRGIVNPSQKAYESFDDLGLSAAVGTKLSAAFIDGGSMLLYQNASSDSTIWLDNVSRYGVEIAKNVVP